MMKLRLLLGLLSVLATCLFFIFREGRSDSDQVESLEMYCAAGLQKPVEEIAKQYEEKHGVKIMLNFGGSGQLLSTLQLIGGDLYLPADVSYIAMANEQDLIVDSIPVSHLTAGIIVQKGNPKNINSLDDFMRDDVKVVIAERSAGVGKFSHLALENAGLLEGVESGMLSKVTTVNEVALQVNLGVSDVGIVWDALIPQFKQCQFIRVLEFDQMPTLATIGVLKGNKREEALKFAKYLSSDEGGAVIFKKYGFQAQFEDQLDE